MILYGYLSETVPRTKTLVASSLWPPHFLDGHVLQGSTIAWFAVCKPPPESVAALSATVIPLLPASFSQDPVYDSSEWNLSWPDQWTSTMKGAEELWHLQPIILWLDCILGVCVLIWMESVQLNLHECFANKLSQHKAMCHLHCAKLSMSLDTPKEVTISPDGWC